MADIALITGATRGLGHTAARRLAEHGCTVLLGARDLERGRAAAAKIVGTADEVRPIVVDVTSDASVAEAVATVEREHGRLDVLVNNAGIAGPHVTVEDTGPDELQEVFETDVLGPVRTTRAFLPLLRKAENPRVVMVSSGLGSFALTADRAVGRVWAPVTSWRGARRTVWRSRALASTGGVRGTTRVRAGRGADRARSGGRGGHPLRR